MKWYLLKLVTNQGAADALSEELISLGALSVTLSDGADDPLYEIVPTAAPLWRETVCTAMFESEEILRSVTNSLNLAGSQTDIRVLEDRDWISEIHRLKSQLKFGDLWVIPPGQTPYGHPKQVVFLEPGIAFGTGAHPTTALCLKWLSDNPLDQKRALDFGCGSGILAIAALKCGARSVYAVDHHVQALEATRQNAIRNGVGKQLCVVECADVLRSSFDLIISNILLNTLTSLKSRFSSLLAANGTLVLSGITEDQVDQLYNVYRPDFVIVEKRTEQDWVCLALQRKK